MKDFHWGASATRVPPPWPNERCPTHGNFRCAECLGVAEAPGPRGGRGSLSTVAAASAAYKRACEGNAAETRECEGCGQQKPIEEMSTVFLPGTGETYQCETCRGGP